MIFIMPLFGIFKQELLFWCMFLYVYRVCVSVHLQQVIWQKVVVQSAQFGTPVYLAQGFHHVLTGLDLQTKLFVGDFSVFPFIFVKVTKLIIVTTGGWVGEPQTIHQFSCKRSWYKSGGFHWQLHFCQDKYVALFYSIMQPLALSPDCVAASWQNTDTVSSLKLQKLPRANFWHHLYWWPLHWQRFSE